MRSGRPGDVGWCSHVSGGLLRTCAPLHSPQEASVQLKCHYAFQLASHVLNMGMLDLSSFTIPYERLKQIPLLVSPLGMLGGGGVCKSWQNSCNNFCCFSAAVGIARGETRRCNAGNPSFVSNRGVVNWSNGTRVAACTFLWVGLLCILTLLFSVVFSVLFEDFLDLLSDRMTSFQVA